MVRSAGGEGVSMTGKVETLLASVSKYLEFCHTLDGAETNVCRTLRQEWAEFKCKLLSVERNLVALLDALRGEKAMSSGDEAHLAGIRLGRVPAHWARNYSSQATLPLEYYLKLCEERALFYQVCTVQRLCT